MLTQTILPAIGVLVGIIGLIAAVAKLAHFTGWHAPSQPGRTLVLRESIALDPRRRVHLVQCGDRQVVLLTGGGQDVVVGWVPDK
jgi:flagellar protein FliO/FliZ